MKSGKFLLNKLDEPINLSHPLHLNLLIQLLLVFSSIIASIHIVLIEKKWTKIPTMISHSPEGFKKTLHKIWFARMLRRSLSLITRTSLRSKFLGLVHNKLSLPELGCVITIPHTPWARILAEWCRSNSFALVFVGGPWIKRTGQMNIPGVGISGIRKVISHLHTNGNVVIIGDNINRPPYCKVSYLGKECNGSLLPVRLASLAGVSIVTVIPKFIDKRIYLENGLIIDAEEVKLNEQHALQKIFSYFETEMNNSPSIYSPYI